MWWSGRPRADRQVVVGVARYHTSGMYAYATFVFLLAAVGGGSVAAWLLATHDRGQPAFVFGLFMLTVAGWSLAHVGALSTSSITWQLRYTQLSYVAVVTTPLAWLTFALVYTDRGELLSARRLALLSAVPALTLGLVFTAEYHSLFYASIAAGTFDGRPALVTESGPWHAVNIVYSYTVLAVGSGLLLVAAIADSRLHRRQSAVLLVCVLVPWTVNAAYHVGARPIVPVDPSPLVFTLVGIPLAAVVIRTDLRTFVPVAHRRVFRTLGDPVFVVGPDDRVLDANDAATAVFGALASLDGCRVEEVLPAALFADGRPRPALGDAVECSIAHGGERRRYLAQRRDIDPERGADAWGYIVSFTDITVQQRQRDALTETNAALRRQTDALELKNEQLERLAGVVSHDLETPLATGEGLLYLIRADIDDGNPELEQSLDDLETVHRRLRAFAEALPELARESTDVESPVDCDLAEVAGDAWRVVDTGDLTLAIDGTCALRADPRRLQQAFENLFRNVVDHGVRDGSPPGNGPSSGGGAPKGRPRRSATSVTVGTLPAESAAPPAPATQIAGDDSTASTAGNGSTPPTVGAVPSGFYVEDDGPGLPAERREALLEFGVGTGSGSGYGLAIVRTIVEAHGWSLRVTESAVGGARFEVRGIDEGAE
ncbi:histidine kinase N-terminal 7TM domain-containing protein [Halorubrum sp. JWXQ-INN 858]|uniref:sensor histidine kinase n=1 Tax=Halorubrum sp. JWXQ-INN 858 TaxID=2690782 RepID=UPI00190F47AE|nr:histidine kinase N-terminal 7TM domain-containing protein [Halorubrum sp. JWXQ-INN 858]